MDHSIPHNQTAALQELFQINRDLGHAAARVDPQLSQKSVRAAYLIGLLEGAASGTRWPETQTSTARSAGGNP